MLRQDGYTDNEPHDRVAHVARRSNSRNQRDQQVQNTRPVQPGVRERLWHDATSVDRRLRRPQLERLAKAVPLRSAMQQSRVQDRPGEHDQRRVDENLHRRRIRDRFAPVHRGDSRQCDEVPSG